MAKQSWAWGRFGVILAAVFLAACSSVPHPVSDTVDYSDTDAAFRHPDNFTIQRTWNNPRPSYIMRIRKNAALDDELSISRRQFTRCFLDIHEETGAVEDPDKLLRVVTALYLFEKYRVISTTEAVAIPEELGGRVVARSRGEFGLPATRVLKQNGVVIGRTDVVMPFLAFAQMSMVTDKDGSERRAVLRCYVPPRFENLVNALADRIARSMELR